MSGKQAKIINDTELRRLLRLTRKGRHADRDRVMLLLSVKAGLRACEIAGLTWSMALDARGRVDRVLEVRDVIAKKRRGRLVPMNGELHDALVKLHRAVRPTPANPIIVSERGGHMRAAAVVNWFATLYARASLAGCSSHSGRRTFITKAARLVHRVGGSLRDVQQMAGHASIEMTQRYIEGSTPAKHALVRIL
jgi:integrase/recombinase XerD